MNEIKKNLYMIIYEPKRSKAAESTLIRRFGGVRF